MARGRSYQSNFTMGQLSSDLTGRVDLNVYVSAVKGMVNFLPAATGPARRRAGFLDEGAPKFQDKAARLIPFQRARADRLMLEFGDLYVRYFEPDGAPVLSGMAPYETVSPFAEANLVGIRRVQSNDVVYLAHTSATFAPLALERNGATDWSFVTLELVNGPWLDENGNDALTISANHITGVVTLTASAPYFRANQVGERMRFRGQISGAGVAAWTPNKDFEKVNEVVASDGKIYRCTQAGLDTDDTKMGTNPPVHDRGLASDGSVDWEFLHDGSGTVLITAVTDSTHATATVLTMLPTTGVVSGAAPNARRTLDPATNPAFPATPFFAEAAWSNTKGWPTAISDTDDSRLAYGGCLATPGFLALTTTNGWTPAKLDFTPGLGTGRVTDDNGIHRTIAGGGDPIIWLTSSAFLMVGTSSREYAFIGDTIEDPLSAAGARPKRLTDVGSHDVQAVTAADGVIFVPRGGRGLRQVKLGADQTIGDDDLALFAEEIVAGKLAELAWAPHPDNVLWCRTATGELLSLVYHPRQTVFGWQRHPLPAGFTVESLAVQHDDEGYDTLWLVVVREKDAISQRRIWRQAPRWRKTDPVSSMIYLDGSGRYAGAETTTIGNLDHWEGEELRILGQNDAGETYVQTATVDGGEVEFEQPLSSAVVGMKYLSDLETLPLDIQGPAGTVGQLQRVTSVAAYVDDFVSGQIAFGDGPLEPIGGEGWEGGYEPQTVVTRSPVGNVSSRQATVRIRTDDVWPLTLLAIGSEAEANA